METRFTENLLRRVLFSIQQPLCQHALSLENRHLGSCGGTHRESNVLGGPNTFVVDCQ